MLKKLMKRTLPVLMAAVTVLSSSGVTVFADEVTAEGNPENTAIVQEKQDAERSEEASKTDGSP